MKFSRFAFVALLALGLASCSHFSGTTSSGSASTTTTAAPAQGSGVGAHFDDLTTFLTNVLAWPKADLDNAVQLSQGDAIYNPCWVYLDAQVSNAASALGGSTGNGTIGVATAIQIARNLSKGINAGAGEQFDVECGPMISNIVRAAGRLGISGISMLTPSMLNRIREENHIHPGQPVGSALRPDYN